MDLLHCCLVLQTFTEKLSALVLGHKCEGSHCSTLLLYNPLPADIGILFEKDFQLVFTFEVDFFGIRCVIV